MSIVVEVFKPLDDSPDCFTRTVTRGSPAGGSITLVEGVYSSEHQAGSTQLRGVPAGGAVVNDYVRFLGQAYQVGGVVPRAPLGRRVDLDISKTEHDTFRVLDDLTVGGVPLTVGMNDPLQVCVEDA